VNGPTTGHAIHGFLACSFSGFIKLKLFVIVSYIENKDINFVIKKYISMEKHT